MSINDEQIMSRNNYDKLRLLFNENHDKPLSEWTRFKQWLKPGNQGCIGILEVITDDSSDNLIIFKYSNQFDYVILAESLAMTALGEISSFCPFFTRQFGIVESKHICLGSKQKLNKMKSPFEPLDSNSHMVNSDILLMEFNYASDDLEHVIQSKTVHESVIYSSIKQVLFALLVSQMKCGFTHYDLHTGNIMMKKCSLDDVFVYHIDNDNVFFVPTFGYYPVLIDFGYSFTQNMIDQPFWNTMTHSDVGYWCDRSDPYVDMKRFLICTGNDLNEARYSQSSTRFQKQITKLFRTLNDTFDEVGLSEKKFESADKSIIDTINQTCNSRLLTRDLYKAMDIINSLIILPFSTCNRIIIPLDPTLPVGEINDTDDTNNINIDLMIEIELTHLKNHSEKLDNEIQKIEREIQNRNVLLYVFKCMIDAAREVRGDFTANVIETTRAFKIKIYDMVDEICGFCMLSSFNFTLFLMELYRVSECIEVIYKLNMSVMSEDRKTKLKGHVNIETVVGLIERFQDDVINRQYIFNGNTTVHYINCETNTMTLHTKLDSQLCDQVNGLHALCKGSFLKKSLLMG